MLAGKKAVVASSSVIFQPLIGMRTPDWSLLMKFTEQWLALCAGNLFTSEVNDMTEDLNQISPRKMRLVFILLYILISHYLFHIAC